MAFSRDAVPRQGDDLLFEHVVEGRYHPSVITESLRPIIDETLEVATHDDWQAVADRLIAEGREATAIKDIRV